MTPLLRAQHPLPTHVLNQVQEAIDASLAEFLSSEVDYFEATPGVCDEIECVARGTERRTQKHDEWIDHLPDDVPPYWFHRLTGCRVRVRVKPTWYFETFWDRIETAARGAIADYVFAGSKDRDEDVEFLAYCLLPRQIVGRLLRGTRRAG